MQLSAIAGLWLNKVCEVQHVDLDVCSMSFPDRYWWHQAQQHHSNNGPESVKLCSSSPPAVSNNLTGPRSCSSIKEVFTSEQEARPSQQQQTVKDIRNQLVAA